MAFTDAPLFIPFIVVLAVWVLLTVVLCYYKNKNDVSTTHEGAASKITKLKAATDEFSVKYNELVIGKMLGKGSQGEVFMATWRGSAVAVKKIDIRTVSNDIIEEFCSEAEIMRKLRHPSVTLFMGVCLDDPHLCILTELVGQGSLFDIMRDDTKSSQMTWPKAMQIIYDVAQGMAYLHGSKPPILHRDLKSLNILVTENWRGKVADFGMTTFQSNDGIQTQCGSPLWMAPEMIRNETYDGKADVYSFAICMWEVYARKIPYKDLQLAAQSLVLKVAETNVRPSVPDKMPSKYSKLMQRCWNSDPDVRPAFEQIVKEITEMMKDRKLMSHVPFSNKQVIVAHDDSDRRSSAGPEVVIVGEHTWKIDPDMVELDSEDQPKSAGNDNQTIQRPNSVHFATYRGAECCVKIYKIAGDAPWDPNDPATVQLEEKTRDLVSGMGTVRHPNLVLFMGAFIQSGLLAVVSERMIHGCLNTVIENPEYTVDWTSIIQFMIDTAAGMAYLHGRTPPVVHQDFQTKRLLLDKNWHVKIADYSFVDVVGALQKQPVTPQFWLGPEVHADGVVTKQSNVFSFGLIMWELLQRKPPFRGQNLDPSIIERVNNNGERPRLPESLSPRFKKLINDCWHQNPRERPEFQYILEELRGLKKDGPMKLTLVEGTNASVYRKKAIVTAFKSRDPITVLKAWGKNVGKAGAYIICGDAKDVYICEPEVFEQTYEQVGNRDFHQYRKTGTVLARLMAEPFAVKTAGGMVQGLAGDYLVESNTGDQWTVPASNFKELYELCEQTSKGVGKLERTATMSAFSGHEREKRILQRGSERESAGGPSGDESSPEGPPEADPLLSRPGLNVERKRNNSF